LFGGQRADNYNILRCYSGFTAT